jgi:PIN domain
MAPPTPLRVVFDTNILQSEGWALSSTHMVVLEHEAKDGALALYVPEVVRLELEFHGVATAAEGVGQYRNLVRSLSQLGAADDLQTDVRLAADAYPARLSQRLEELHAEILPLPSVSHEQVLKRAIAGRRPFKGGRGYKDTLIWLTVLALIDRVGPPVVLITNDDDFLEGHDVARDLHEDLERAGHPRDAVRVHRSVGEFVAKEIPRVRHVIAEMTRRLDEDEGFRGQLLAEMIALADERGPALLEPHLLEHRDLRPYAIRFRPFQPSAPPKVDETIELAGGQLELSLSLAGHLELLFSFDQQDSGLPLLMPLRSSGSSELVLRTSLDVEFAFAARYTEATGSISNLELTGSHYLVLDASALMGRLASESR